MCPSLVHDHPMPRLGGRHWALDGGCSLNKSKFLLLLLLGEPDGTGTGG